jgi:serine/threonine-protein kinase ATR
MTLIVKAIFRILDYAMRWVQSKRAAMDSSRKDAKRDQRRAEDKANLEYIQSELDAIPPQSISHCAVQCNDYARALLHLEQHAQKMENERRRPGERTALLQDMQRMYANIDEPDGLEGISAHLPVLDIHNQILSHKKAGRWTAAQTWYEMQLAEQPDNLDVQIDLLNCLKQAGQHGVCFSSPTWIWLIACRCPAALR